MKVFVTIDEDGNLGAASVKNPIQCMKLIENNEAFDSIISDYGLTEIDMINFEDYLQNFVSRGLANIVEVSE